MSVKALKNIDPAMQVDAHRHVLLQRQYPSYFLLSVATSIIRPSPRLDQTSSRVTCFLFKILPNQDTHTLFPLSRSLFQPLLPRVMLPSPKKDAHNQLSSALLALFRNPRAQLHPQAFPLSTLPSKIAPSPIQNLIHLPGTTPN